MKIYFVYITASSLKEAKKIGSALVKEKLAACINIFPKIISIYEWKGKNECAEEAVLIAKTTQRRLLRLKKRVKTLHSYEVPCIAVIPVKDCNQEYHNWILAQTSNSAKTGA